MSPVLLAVLVLVALVVGTYFALGRSRGETTRQRNRAPLRKRPTGWVRVAPIVLLLGAGACLVVAILQFRTNRTDQATIVLVFDVSDSMEQQDVQPNRLAAAEAAALAFTEQLPKDFRVGLVTFAGSARELVAPTDDREQVATALSGLTTSRGTVIGDGLTTALDTLDEQGGGPAAVLLLSDGRDTGSEVSPHQAAERAAERGINVFTVTLGEASGGANAVLLDEIAATTGAQSFTAGTAGELTQVYEELGSQLSSSLEIGNLGQVFVIAAVLLAIGAAIAVLLASRNTY
jgi:Ca-activated chloride channel homolog